MSEFLQMQEEGRQHWDLPSAQTYLLVFDVHQDIKWLDRILEKESGSFDHLILGGDYFDAYDKASMTSRSDVARYLDQLVDRFEGKITVLLGNHDMPYLVTEMTGSREIHDFYLDHDDHNRIRTIQGMPKILSERFWPKGQFFASAYGYLISHAGVAAEFWPPFANDEEALELLWSKCVDAMEMALAIENEEIGAGEIISAPILRAGRVRGGVDQERGGVIWQDWRMEFSDDDIPLPQIVGHTRSKEGARQNGRSWCLDGAQSCYGLLDANGVKVHRA